MAELASAPYVVRYEPYAEPECGCEWSVDGYADGRTWCAQRATEKAVWSDDTNQQDHYHYDSNLNYLCNAHYIEWQAKQSVATPARLAPISPTELYVSFDAICAAMVTLPTLTLQPLRVALHPYLRMTNAQLTRHRGRWFEVAAALVIRQLRRRGLLDDLLVQDGRVVVETMSRAAIRAGRRTLRRT